MPRKPRAAHPAAEPIAATSVDQPEPLSEVSSEELVVEARVVEPVEEEIPIGNMADDPQDIEVEIRNQERGGSTSSGMQQIARDLLRLVRENAERLGAGAMAQLQGALKDGMGDYLDPDFWRGIGMVLEYQVTELRGMIQRRLKGEYSTDPYGRDDEVIELMRPIAGFLYRSWWRVRVSGLEHVPAEGGALLVANHAGVVPWDGAMLATAILEDHTAPRLLRILHQKLISAIPILAPTLAALGQAPALPANAERLLAEGELVGVFPEGARGAGKLFRDRYQLKGFDAAAYVQAALRAGTPIVPVAIIGAEETYPVILNLDKAAKLLGLPYLPITPLFPWAGLLGLIPLPSKWAILFDEALDTSGLGAEAADDAAAIARLTQELQARLEALIARGLAERGSAFIG